MQETENLFHLILTFVIKFGRHNEICLQIFIVTLLIVRTLACVGLALCQISVKYLHLSGGI